MSEESLSRRKFYLMFFFFVHDRYIFMILKGEGEIVVGKSKSQRRGNKTKVVD